MDSGIQPDNLKTTKGQGDAMNKDMNNKVCKICGVEIPDYDPEYCCNSTDCACRGMPIYPPWCDDCWDRIILKKERNIDQQEPHVDKTWTDRGTL